MPLLELYPKTFDAAAPIVKYALRATHPLCHVSVVVDVIMNQYIVLKRVAATMPPLEREHTCCAGDKLRHGALLADFD